MVDESKKIVDGSIKLARFALCDGGNGPSPVAYSESNPCHTALTATIEDAYKTVGDNPQKRDALAKIIHRTFAVPFARNADICKDTSVATPHQVAQCKAKLSPYVTGKGSESIGNTADTQQFDTFAGAVGAAATAIASGTATETVEALKPPVPATPATPSAEAKAFIKAATPLLGAASKTHKASIDKALKEFAERVDTVTASLPAAEGIAARKTLFDQAKTKVTELKTAYLTEAGTDEGKAFAALLSGLYGLIPVLNVKADKKTLEPYILETITSLVAPVLKMIGDAVDADGEEALALTSKLLIRAMSHPNVTKKDAANLTALAGALAKALEGELKGDSPTSLISRRTLAYDPSSGGLREIVKAAKDAKPILEKIFTELNIDVEVDGDGKPTKVSFSERKVTGEGSSGFWDKTLFLVSPSYTNGGGLTGAFKISEAPIGTKGPFELGFSAKGAAAYVPGGFDLPGYTTALDLGRTNTDDSIALLQILSLSLAANAPVGEFKLASKFSGGFLDARTADPAKGPAGEHFVWDKRQTLHGTVLGGQLGASASYGRFSLGGSYLTGRPFSLGYPFYADGWKNTWESHVGVSANPGDVFSAEIAVGQEFVYGPKKAGDLLFLSGFLQFNIKDIVTLQPFFRLTSEEHPSFQNLDRSGPHVGLTVSGNLPAPGGQGSEISWQVSGLHTWYSGVPRADNKVLAPQDEDVVGGTRGKPPALPAGSNLLGENQLSAVAQVAWRPFNGVFGLEFKTGPAWSWAAAGGDSTEMAWLSALTLTWSAPPKK